MGAGGAWLAHAGAKAVRIFDRVHDMIDERAMTIQVTLTSRRTAGCSLTAIGAEGSCYPRTTGTPIVLSLTNGSRPSLGHGAMPPPLSYEQSV